MRLDVVENAPDARAYQAWPWIGIRYRCCSQNLLPVARFLPGQNGEYDNSSRGTREASFHDLCRKVRPNSPHRRRRRA
jgi:hypothetical protein